MQLSRLLYTSQCAIDGDADARLAAIRDLAHSSAVRNGEAGLTGSLLHVDDSFIQVLEGDSDTIESVFEAICRDFRHRDVRIIDFSPIRERLFSDWPMALLTEEPGAPREMQEELRRIRTMAGVSAHSATHEMRTLLHALETA